MVTYRHRLEAWLFHSTAPGIVVRARVQGRAKFRRAVGVDSAAAAAAAAGRLWTGPKEGAVRVAKTRG